MNFGQKDGSEVLWNTFFKVKTIQLWDQDTFKYTKSSKIK